MRKPLLLVFFCVLTSLPVLAQESRQYSFTHYGTSTGLISNELYQILQDTQRFIWIGTNNGLQRFDGVRYLTFRHNKDNPSSIPSNLIFQMLLDKDGNIWLMLGDDKFGKFDTRRFTFKEIKVKYENAKSPSSEKKMVLDERGNLMLLAMKSEILTYDAETNEFSSKKNFIPYPKDWEIIDLVSQKGTRRYWMGGNRGIVIYNASNKKLSYKGHNEESDPAIEKFGTQPWPTEFFFDDRDRVWFAYWMGGGPFIDCFDYKGNAVLLENYSVMKFVHTYHELRGFVQQKDGTIWIKGRGVLGHYMEAEKEFQMVYNGYVSEQSIMYEGLSAICEDSEHNLWLGTSNNGLYRFNPAEQYFTNIRHMNPITKIAGEGSVMSFHLLNDSSLLVGTWGDGLYRYDKHFNPMPHGISGFINNPLPLIWDMSSSADGNTIWMGGQPGFYTFDQRKKLATYYHPPILKERTVRQIEEDVMGNVWIGTQGLGLYKLTIRKGKPIKDEDVALYKELGKAMILKIYSDSKGMIWVGTSDGVSMIDPHTDKLVMQFKYQYEDGKKVPLLNIAGIIEYDDSTMIIAGGSSIHVYNRYTKRINSIGSPDFLNGSITSVEKDGKTGFLWVSMSHGIHRVNIRNKIFVHFDRNDGITNDRFVFAASAKLPDGRLLFGADNQFTIFDPSSVYTSNVAPPVVITGFKLLNEPLLVDSLMKLEKVELKPKENSLAIEFSGLSYSGVYRIRYMLEGLDKTWKLADQNNQAIYSYLPPGTYTFLVKSEDADGKEGKSITKLVIEVTPPFWRTWWFFGLIILLGAVILYWIDRERIRRINDMQKVRSEIATNLHEDVTATLSNINLLGEMAKMKADKDIDRSKEYIDQISSKSHNMIIAMDDILWSIDPENDSMEKTLLRMMEFTDSMKNRHGAVIELALDKKVRSLKLDMKTRHEFFLIFKEGLRLIVQYAEGRNTLINIDLFKNRLSMKLQDVSGHLDTHIAEIEQIIKEINSRAGSISADLDIQYDKAGIAVVLLIPVK